MDTSTIQLGDPIGSYRWTAATGCPAEHANPWYCTMPKGHKGPHIAEGMRCVLAIWDDSGVKVLDA